MAPQPSSTCSARSPTRPGRTGRLRGSGRSTLPYLLTSTFVHHRSSRNPRLPELKPLSAGFNLIIFRKKSHFAPVASVNTAVTMQYRVNNNNNTLHCALIGCVGNVFLGRCLDQFGTNSGLQGDGTDVRRAPQVAGQARTHRAQHRRVSGGWVGVGGYSWLGLRFRAKLSASF